MSRTQVARSASQPAGVISPAASQADAASQAAVTIRPVSLADEPVLRDFFAALSVESRYLRFFAPVTPSCGLLDLMVGKPAHVDAIIAVADGAIVGHAMAADRPAPGGSARGDSAPGGPRATDVGVVVADGWQRRGVGAALMRALIGRAQARGVTSLAMDVLPGNRRVLAMISGHWPQAALSHGADSVDVRIPLPRYQPRPLAAAVRPFATAVRPLAAAAVGPLASALSPLASAVRPLVSAVGKPLAAAAR